MLIFCLSVKKRIDQQILWSRFVTYFWLIFYSFISLRKFSTQVPPKECTAFWPHSKLETKTLKAKVAGYPEKTAAFLYTDVHSTLLKLDNKVCWIDFNKFFLNWKKKYCTQYSWFSKIINSINNSNFPFCSTEVLMWMCKSTKEESTYRCQPTHPEMLQH